MHGRSGEQCLARQTSLRPGGTGGTVGREMLCGSFVSAWTARRDFCGTIPALSRGPWGRLVPTRERIQKNPRIGQSFVMRRISGRCQRGIRYALWALCEATTMEVLEYCYSWPSEDRGQRKNRARAACLAARKMAIVVGRHGPTATDGGSRPTICLRCTEKPHQKPSAKCEQNRVC